ncbi:MAG: BlaI/MecI/CopY family transcriptional regulator [Acidobacteria bacterium]|nr:BlaI/MecI/CopY family transcriptional regulator [Acidobacteriota bacterium]
MSRPAEQGLSRREREIMDIVFRCGRVGVLEVLEEMELPPSYSAVRATLRILEGKGHLRHEEQGQRYVFLPTVPVKKARESALERLVTTFFGGSPEQAIVALLDISKDELDSERLARLERRIVEARKGEMK